MKTPARLRKSRSSFRTVLPVLALVLAATLANAAETEIAAVPLASSSTTAVKPNVLFVLDDSGSMAWTHMPDDIVGGVSRVGYRNHMCNSVYYNPSITYLPPKNADGTDFPNASFTAAKWNGYDSGSSSVNLSLSNFRAFESATLTSSNYGGNNDTAQPAYYYKWTATTGPATLSVTSTQCDDASPSSSSPHSVSITGGTWTKVVVSATSGPGSTDERTNFANWYSYYRTRLMTMKASASRAFSELDSSYRIGFITINPNNPVSDDKFLGVADFGTTQKSAFFTKLFATTNNGSTPLRVALSRAGRYFAGKSDGINNGMSDDPVQYSCQQNFAILTTDGYWNGGGGQMLDQSDMNDAEDNQDGNTTVTPRPLYDGALATITDSTVRKDYFWSSYGAGSCSSSRRRIRVTTTTTTRVRTYDGGGNLVSDVTDDDTNTSNYSSTCYTGSSALPTPSPLNVANPTITTTNGVAGSSGGSLDSLADVAQYYYRGGIDRSDAGAGLYSLRAAGALGAPVGSPAGQNDVGTSCNVPATGSGAEDDKNPCQHMTTFTLGMGLAGTLNYRSDYKTATSGHFAEIRAGTRNWPIPGNDDPTALDDLWHAAVNGRGAFFSASDPDTVKDGLLSALAGINARVASAAAAATSNLEPVAGDNFAYVAKYETQSWTGELEAHEIDLDTGSVQSTVIWSAQAKLDAKVFDACDNRNIRLFRSGAADNLVNFTWNTSACASGLPTGTAATGLDTTEQDYFTDTAALGSSLSQWTDMDASQKTAATGANLVNFIRGQRGKEGFIAADVNGLYREREHVLGDIVNAQPVYVKSPFANYTDAGYSAYKTSKASRTPMVYVAANDGMLHAFYAGTSASDAQGGEEAWAFIPTMVLPNLSKLASANYANSHAYFVDGTPTVGDVCTANCATEATAVWKTILVGGMNFGGKGYYALDVSDPANPKALWEFKHSTTCYAAGTSSTHYADCNIGYTYGNPIITKMGSQWVVLITSGYNNVNSTPAAGDGLGHLYVLEANTGRILHKISTTAGSAATPSGLNKINNWVDDTLTNNSTLRVYGVDLLGNVWRFDINDTLDPAGREATRIATVVDGAGVAQPITTRPELAEVGSPPSPFVYVATGRYLGNGDIPTTSVTPQTQSIYAFKDPLTATAYAALRTSLKQQVITNVGVGAGSTRTVACPAATGNCASTDGWFVDLPDRGERVNVDMKLQLGTVVVASNVPENSACTIGGYSWLNFFDFRTGAAIVTSSAGAIGVKLSDSLAVGLNIVRLPSGRTVVIATTSDAKQQTIEAPFDTPAPSGKRISWREIVQ